MFITSSCYNEPGNTYLFDLYGAVCNMLSFMVSSSSYVLRRLFVFCFEWFFQQCICCTFSAQVCRYQGAHLDLPLKWSRTHFSLSNMHYVCVCICVAWRQVILRARSAVQTSPGACWEEEAWWQGKTWSFCRASQQTQPTDISEDSLSVAMHVIRQRGDGQRGRAVTDVAPNTPVRILSQRLAQMLASRMKIEGLWQPKARQPLRTREVWKHNTASRL